MTTNYCVFKPKVVEEVTSITLSEVIDIIPKIEEQDKLFVENSKIFESIVFENDDATNTLYLLFREWIDQTTGEPKEQSRINFISVDKFPDGCFFLKDSNSKKIKCYICEMKHRPGDKILRIAEQFYSGYVHCKTFFSAVGLDQEYQIEYQYYIVGYIEKYDYYEKQLESQGAIRPVPGVRPLTPAMTPELRAYTNYKIGTIYYAYTSDYQHKISFPTEFIKLDYQDTDTENKIVNLNSRKNLSLT